MMLDFLHSELLQVFHQGKIRDKMGIPETVVSIGTILTRGLLNTITQWDALITHPESVWHPSR